MSRITRSLAPLLFTAAALAGGLLQAQTVAVTPSNESVGVNLTKQFTAMVTGLANSSVTWMVAGVPGGTMAAGTIDANGLYRAPATLPGQNPVQISALSMADGTTKGSVYLNVLSAGATLSTVTPNPMAVGTVNVVATGIGFVPGATIWINNVQLSTSFVNSTTLKGSIYLGSKGSAIVSVRNPGAMPSNWISIPILSSGGGSGTSTAATIAPLKPQVVLGATQQFTGTNVTGWSTVAGTITAAGLYTAPAAMPASGTDTVTGTGAGGNASTVVTLIPSTPPAITSLSLPSLPLGIFSASITGTGFINGSAATLNGSAMTTTFVNATTLNVTGFAGTAGLASLLVKNGPLASQPYSVQVGVANPVVSASAARRFLEQAAFGPTPTDAAHVQQVGFQAWITEQLNMPKISNYSNIFGSSGGGMGTHFLTNAVSSPDQLRQRVAFALSQIFVTSIQKLIFDGNIVPYEEMLLTDAFSNYPQILSDVTLSPAMGNYLDMANNAKANPASNSVANENYAREVLQLFSLGTSMLNIDGTVQKDVNNLPVPTYSQFTVTEFARVFTGWTYAPTSGTTPVWGSYINPSKPMLPYPPMHDSGAKTLLNGAVNQAGLSPQADLTAALANIVAHPNLAPFFSKLLIQHLVKSNPSPTYIKNVATAFNNSNGDMPTVITTILLDPEARANDEGGQDQATDGHLQEPALFIAGMVRAFGGTMNDQNYYNSDLVTLGQDIFQAPSVFNYYSESSRAPGTSLFGGEFQLHNPNNAINRANVVYALFSAYQNPVSTNGPGTLVDLTPFVALPVATMVDALDLTLTHGTMPAAMKSTIITAVNGDPNGTVHRVQTAVWLILSSSYYNVWH